MATARPIDPDPGDEPPPLTLHQRMLAEIEAALCASDPITAAMHVRRANSYARRFSETTPAPTSQIRRVA
jgi:hypothetical protein